MKQKEVKLKSGEEYLTLGVLLKISGIISTGGMAKAFLAENFPLINGEQDNRRGRKLYDGDVVEVLGQQFIIRK